MSLSVTIHYKNVQQFAEPHLWVWYTGSNSPDQFAPTGMDSFGHIFTADVKRPTFFFKFKDGVGTEGPWESDSLSRSFRQLEGEPTVTTFITEVWCRGDKAFVYPVLPREAESIPASSFLATVKPKPGIAFSDTGGKSGLGATLLVGEGTLFGFYHPNAARVYVMGSFNEWQRPGHDNPDPNKFCELRLYEGYFGTPNLWLGVIPEAKAGDEYKFCVQGGVASDEKGRFQQYFSDPYTRQLGPNFSTNNSVIVDPTQFEWTDGDWETPDKANLIIYELSVFGFTEGDPGINQPGKFAGITERIEGGYFNDLGITALSLMPLAEFPTPQGDRTLGYNSSLFCAVERDFGSPDDLRTLVNSAHSRGLAIILDQVFNHTDNAFNPLWRMILEHPNEEFDHDEGGLYFNGSTRWGNRIATEKLDVQNLLIDTCKLLLKEYHVDGFRFDATNTQYMDHGFLYRLAPELTAIKPSVILVVENLPNQSDLNRSGFDGFMQWADPFHDKLKALLREGTFDNSNFYNTDKLADIFFFCKSLYATHTNNVINYVESHDETSVAYEVSTNPLLNNSATKDRKGRLGLFATMVALGQPMLYMGGEFNVERDRNIVSFSWPADGPDSNGFFRWARRLIRLRRRYPSLKLTGDRLTADGRFGWILGPWLDNRHGQNKRLLGWRLQPNSSAHERMVILLNFENHSVNVDIELGRAGRWVKLADLDTVNDISPEGTNSSHESSTLQSNDGRFLNFSLPSSSGFIYKWEP
ncbi:alpha-amylase family glycosyl hydrolase [Spirosoma endbachense]|uniref:1,4-alpha-glucan branching protein n=1 Tax=Spirosoma endbachense TaxID=2666025 RepID=A0A6P1VTR7_9BACT|nr:alpha-amylase family glycosyl hydrolase [Spirosoma endbachense]QHV95127.1 1,4-alpha-glucan branching protein [Spirosoma endbachense]